MVNKNIKYSHQKKKVLKYLAICFKELNINNITIKQNQENINVYLTVQGTSNINLKKQFYFEQSLKNFLNLSCRLYIINLNLLKNKSLEKKIFTVLNNYTKLFQTKLPDFKLLLIVFLYSIFFKNLKFLIGILKTLFEKNFKHFKVLKNLNYFFNYFFKLNPRLLGLKLQIKGRLNGSLRAKKYVLILGNLSSQTIMTTKLYDQSQSKTNYGICGIKLWISIY